MDFRYLCKAKKLSNGTWVTGYYMYAKERDKHYIIDTENELVKSIINPKTLCQCTGFRDSEGTLIFENDYLEVEYVGNFCNVRSTEVFVVEYRKQSTEIVLKSFLRTLKLSSRLIYASKYINNKFDIPYGSRLPEFKSKTAIDQKGRVTIPYRIRNELGLLHNTDVKMEVVADADERFIKLKLPDGSLESTPTPEPVLNSNDVDVLGEEISYD